MADVNLTCTVHSNDLLPLFCKDCDHLLCCDCITHDHAGHKLCNVSEVVEFHQQELQGVLKNEKSIQFLERLVVDSQGEQDRLAQHTEDLLRNVIDREEEIIAKVRIWRENLTDMIIQFREERDKYLKEKKNIISALLKMRERDIHLESERCNLEIIRINCAVRGLVDANESSSDETSDLIGFEIGSSSRYLNDIFGKISETEMSSDEISFNEAEKAKKMEEDEEEFYDCEGLHRCTFRTKSIKDIIPLQNLQTFLLSSGSIGTDPGSRFCTTGMTTDKQNNILLAVQNDNAIHLLDKSLTFQKLLMTAEDGLYRPTSVALDRDGYLWVGCENGELHIVNYRYLLNTDRQTRLKRKQRVIIKAKNMVQWRIEKFLNGDRGQ
ncbi:uncharacterized protein LOC125676724 [Ostrea edulis]|uniref:uncharacterized protein LOC125676724 n=1 Tax=Ostrea edulis TaxID=37623 RepID=UPI0024AF8BFD|nr:uncharacterized protein LOC125676724 [Ostrea edulis]